MSKAYPVINRDLLITASLLHDIGKTKELSAFPLNDYTDEGQLLGHIYMGAQMINDLARQIPEFPEVLKNELIHCILSHHGELEYGSPKKPALVEAVALNLADNTDARMETITEIFAANKSKNCLLYTSGGCIAQEKDYLHDKKNTASALIKVCHRIIDCHVTFGFHIRGDRGNNTQMICFKETIKLSNLIIAVSYTHLDVYKRQFQKYSIH